MSCTGFPARELSTALGSPKLRAGRGDLGDGRADVRVTRRHDLLAKVRHVGDVVPEAGVEGDGALGLEELQMAADVGGVTGGHGGSRSEWVGSCNVSDLRSLRTSRPSGCLVIFRAASRTLAGGLPQVRVEPLRVGYTDLHCHLLPGVDDGPATMAESVEYAAAAAGAGTTTIVAPPHVELVDVSELPDHVRALRVALESEGVTLDVRCGGELKPFSIP